MNLKDVVNEIEKLYIYDGLMFNDAYIKAKEIYEDYEKIRDCIDEE